MAKDIRIIPSSGQINVTGSADFRGAGGTSVLYISGSGRVGVKTTDPSDDFHVAGTFRATDTTGHRIGNGTDTSVALSILDTGMTAGDTNVLTLGRNAANNNQAEITFHLAQTGSTSNRLQLGLYNSNNTLNILGSGRVGIGTVSPAQKLHIVGAQVRLDSNTGGYYQYNTSGTFRFALYDQGSVTSLYGDGDGSNPAISINSGNIGINTTSPVAKLDINTTTGTAILLRNGDNATGTTNRVQLRFSFQGTDDYSHYITTRHNSANVTGNALDFYVGDTTANGSYPTNATHNLTLEAGNVGIGIKSPTTTLHISGGDNFRTVQLEHNNPGIYFKDQGYTQGYHIGYNADELYILRDSDGDGDYNNILASWNSTRYKVWGNQEIGGNLTVDGIVTAKEFHTTFVSASIIYQSGSTKFGDTADDVHEFTGSVYISGSIVTTGIESNAIIGSSELGSWPANNAYAYFGHKSLNHGSSNNYAILHQNNGTLFINSAGGNAIRFRHNNSDKMLLNSDGNLGIGTTSPVQKLHLTHNGDVALALQNQADTSGNYWALWQDNWNGANNFTFNIAYGGTNFLTVKTDGNVGIGTTNPSEQLHVSGAIQASSFITVRGDDNRVISKYNNPTENSVNLGTYFNAYSFIDLAASDSSWIDFSNANGDDYDGRIRYWNGANRFDFYTNASSTPTLSVKNTAVGIGMINPSQTLTVSGSGEFGGVSPRLYLGNRGSAYSDTQIRFNDFTWGIYDNNRADFFIRRTWTSNLGDYLKINNVTSGADDWITLSANSGSLFYTDNNLRMRIAGNGNIGIGTNSPEVGLQFHGSVDGEHLMLISNTKTYGIGTGTNETAALGFAIKENVTTSLGRLFGKIIASTNAENDSSHGTLTFQVRNSGALTDTMAIKNTGKIILSKYGSGTHTGTAAYNLQVDSSGNVIETAVPATSTVGGGGVANEVAVFSDGSNISGSQAFVYTSTGNVGINVSSPSQKLDVNGTALIRNTIYVGDNIQHWGDGGTGMYFGTDQVQLQNDGGTTRLHIGTGGSVGIGTTSPQARLEIYQSGSTVLDVQGSQGQLFSVTDSLEGSLFSVNDISGLPILEVFDTDKVVAGQFGTNALVVSGSKVGIGTDAPYSYTNYNHVTVDGTNGAGYMLRINGTNKYEHYVDSSGAIFYLIDNDPLKFFTNSTERMRIAGNGDVGIGTTTPAYTLDVTGDIRVTDDMFVNDDLTVGSAGNGLIQVGSIGYLSGASTSIFDIYSPGDIRFNADSNNNGNSAVIFQESGDEKMRITHQGRVGIGTSSPNFPLSVQESQASANNRIIANFSKDSTGNQYGSSIVRIGRTQLTGLSASADIQALDLEFNSGGGGPFRYGTYADAVISNGSSATNGAYGSIHFATSGSVRMTVGGGTLGGNVGIGTTSPSTLLSLGNAVDAQKLLLYDNTNNFKYGFGIQSDEFRQFFPSNSAARLVIGTVSTSDGSTFSEKVRIKSDGNVGIGTTSPNARLHVYGAGSTSSTYAAQFRNSNGSNIIYMRNDGVVVMQHGYFYVDHSDGIYSNGSIKARGGVTDDGGNLGLGGHGNVSNLTLSGSEYAKFNGDLVVPNRSIGIGTTSPAVKFHIKNSSEETIRLEGSNNTTAIHFWSGSNRTGILGHSNGTSIASAADPGDMVLRSESGKKVHIATNGASARMTVDAGGRIGMNNTAPSYRLDIKNTSSEDANMAIRNSGTGHAGIWIDGSNGDLSGNDYSWIGQRNSSLLFEMRTAPNAGNIFLNPRDGAGAVDIAGDLTVDGIITAQEFHTTFVSASIVFQSGSTKFGNSSDDIHEFTGKVGIGTNAPENTLHLLTSTTDTTQQLLIQNGSTGDAAIKFNISGDTYSVGIDNSDSDKFKISYGNLGTNDRITIDSNGNVGMGTTSPQARLDVAGQIITSDSVRFTSNVSTPTGNSVFRPASNTLAFGTDSTERVRIDSNGNVGIGTTSPGAQLELRDGSGLKIISANAKIQFGDSSLSQFLKMDGSGNLELLRNNQSTVNVHFNQSGKLGLNTDSPTGSLHINQNNASIQNKGYETTSNPDPNSSDNAAITIDGNYTDGKYRSRFIKVDRGGNLSVYYQESRGTAHDFDNKVRFGDNSNSAADLQVFGEFEARGIIRLTHSSGAQRIVMGNRDSSGVHNPSIIEAANGQLLFGGGNDWSPSGSAANGGTMDYTMTLSDTNRVGIGTISPAVKLDVDAGTSDTIAVFRSSDNRGRLQIEDNDTNIYVIAEGSKASFGLTSTLATTNLNVDSAGNVGIGTTAPASPLHVKEDTSTVYDATAYQKDLIVERKNTSGDNQSAHIRFLVTGYEGQTTGEASIGVIQTSNASSGHTVFTNRHNGTRSETLRIKSDGNVGIGTTAPSDKLHVQEGDIRVDDPNNGTTRGLFIRHSGITGNVTSLVQDTSSTPRALLRSSERSLWIQAGSDGGAPASDLRLYANQTLGLMVSSSGNIGIKNTTPTVALDVSGEIAIRGGESADDARMYFRASDNSNRFTIETDLDGTTANDLLGFRAAQADNILVLKGDGNVGIGTTAPGYKLDVAGALNINANSTNGIRFEDDGTFTTLNADAVLRVNQRVEVWGGGAGKQYLDVRDQSGNVKVMLNAEDNSYFAVNNVGIGTTSPAEKLHVVGAARIDTIGNATTDTDKFLVSDSGTIKYRTTSQLKSDLDLESYIFTLPNTGGTAQWVKVGTVNLPQQGRTATVKIVSNQGYNASTSQNFEVHIRLKTSNASSQNSDGFYGDSSFYVTGINDTIGPGDVVWSGSTADHNYDLFVNFGSFTGAGSYYVAEVPAGSWTDVGDLGQSVIGAGSSTELVSTERFDISSNVDIDGNLDVAGEAYVGTKLGIGTTSPDAPLTIHNSSDPEIRFGYSTSQDHRINWDSSKVFIHADPDNANASSALGLFVDGTAQLYITDGGSVGIGTTSPLTPFHIQSTDPTDNIGMAYLENKYTSGGVYFPALQAYNSASNHSYGTVAEFRTGGGGGTDRPSVLFSNDHQDHFWTVGQGGYGANDNFAITYRDFHPKTGGGWGTARFVIDTGGKVGIGTTSPDQTLHVFKGSAGSIASNANAIITAENSQNGYVQVLVPSANESGILFGNPDNAADGGIIYNNSDTSDGLQFRTNGNSTKMVIDGSGRVGIGTTSPGEKLDVVGNIKAQYNGNNYSRVGQTSSGGYLQAYSGAVEKIMFRSYGDSFINGGNLGLGTDNPSAGLHISRSMNAAWLASFENKSDSGHGLIIIAGGTSGTRYITQWKDAAGTERFHMDDTGEAYFAGSVGIGTTSPTQKLEVNGNALVDNLYLGSTTTRLSTNGSGEVGIDYNNSATSTYGFSVYNGSTTRVFGVKRATGDVETNGDLTVDGNIYQSNYAFHRFNVGNTRGYIWGNHNYTGSVDSGTFQDDLVISTNWEGVTGNANNFHNSATWVGNAALSVGRHDFRFFGSRSGSVAPSELMRLTLNDGYLGIGTSSPTDPLTVAGVIKSIGGTNNGKYVQMYVNDSFAYYTTNAGVIYMNTELQVNTGRIGSYDEDLSLETSGTTRITVANSDGNVGIGTTSPAAKLEIYQSGSVALDVQGSQGQLFSVTDSLEGSLFSVNDISGLPILEVFDTDKVVAGQFGTNALVVSGSRVGIGTDAPTRKLHVSAGSDYPAVFDSTQDYTLGLARSGTEEWWLKTYTDGRFAIHENGVGDKVTIKAGGNVGIGTTSPAGKLQIEAADGGDTRYIRTVLPAASSYNPASYNTEERVVSGFKFGWYSDYWQIGAARGGGTDVDGLIFSRNGTETLVLKEDGNVGIGVTSPGAKLDVEGGALGTTNGDTATAAIIRAGRQNLIFRDTRTADGTDWNNATFKIIAAIDSTSHQSIDFVNDGSYLEHIDIRTGNQVFNTRFTAGGLVGIGTTSPGEKLAVDGNIQILDTDTTDGNILGYLNFHSTNGGSSGNHARIAAIRDSAAAGQMLFYTKTGGAPSEKMRIQSDGNVGVNKTNPSRKLEVGGDFEAEAITINNEFTFPTTDGSANQVLQTNGSGTVSWATVSGGAASTINTVASNTNATRYLTFVDSNNATAAAETLYTTDGIYINPSTDTIYATGNIISYASSDKRLKDNLTPISGALDKIGEVSGYEFDWNGKAIDFKGHDVGVVAQEIEIILPEVVATRKDGYKAVKYEKIVPLLIEGIKEQKDIVEKQQKEIDELKSELKAIRDMLLQKP